MPENDESQPALPTAAAGVCETPAKKAPAKRTGPNIFGYDPNNWPPRS